MTDASENPFQSPQGFEPKVVRWQRTEEASKGKDEILLGSTVASGLRYLLLYLVVFSAAIGITFVCLAGMGFYLIGTEAITLAVIAFVVVAAPVYFAANYAQIHAPLMLNSYCVSGYFAIDRQKFEMDIPWKELCTYKLDQQGFLHLEAKEGETYSIFVNWLPQNEREQLLACCQKQLDGDSESSHGLA